MLSHFVLAPALFFFRQSLFRGHFFRRAPLNGIASLRHKRTPDGNHPLPEHRVAMAATDHGLRGGDPALLGRFGSAPGHQAALIVLVIGDHARWPCRGVSFRQRQKARP